MFEQPLYRQALASGLDARGLELDLVQLQVDLQGRGVKLGPAERRDQGGRATGFEAPQVVSRAGAGELAWLLTGMFGCGGEAVAAEAVECERKA